MARLLGAAADPSAPHRMYRPVIWSVKEQRHVMPIAFEYATVMQSPLDAVARVRCTMRLGHRLEGDVLRISIGRLADGSSVKLKALSQWFVRLPVLPPAVAAEVNEHHFCAEDLAMLMEVVARRQFQLDLDGHVAPDGFSAATIRAHMDWVARFS